MKSNAVILMLMIFSAKADDGLSTKRTNLVNASKIQIYMGERGTDNGCGAFACVKNGKILSAENQDLWRGAHVDVPKKGSTTVPVEVWPKLLFQPDPVNEVIQAFEAIEKLKDFNLHFYQQVKAELDIVIQIYKIVDFRNPIVGDSDRTKSKDDCDQEGAEPAFFQSALYEENGLLSYNDNVWEKLDPNHKAAQHSHEAIYQVMDHYYGEDKSDHTMEINALLYAIDPPLERLREAIPAPGFVVNGNRSYEEKVADLAFRFSKAHLPKLSDFVKDGKSKNGFSRSCYEFEKVPTSYPPNYRVSNISGFFIRDGKLYRNNNLMEKFEYPFISATNGKDLFKAVSKSSHWVTRFRVDENGDLLGAHSFLEKGNLRDRKKNHRFSEPDIYYFCPRPGGTH